MTETVGPTEQQVSDVKVDDSIVSFRDKYAFLSNFFVYPLRYNGISWLSAEHAFQAQKTTHPVEYYKIRDAATPADAKRIGRTVKIREDWEAVKIDIMREIIRAKFEDERLQELLLKTGTVRLIEGNTWRDKIWGAVQNSRGDWCGRNLLGKILMEIRQELQQNQLDGQVYSTGEVARMLRVTSKCVRDYVDDGRLPVAKIVGNKNYRFRHDDVMKFKESWRKRAA